MFKRVVYIPSTGKYQIHRFSFWFGNQVWENDDGKGYWWIYYPYNATNFNSPEEAIRVYNSVRNNGKLKRTKTIRRFI